MLIDPGCRITFGGMASAEMDIFLPDPEAAGGYSENAKYEQSILDAPTLHPLIDQTNKTPWVHLDVRLHAVATSEIARSINILVSWKKILGWIARPQDDKDVPHATNEPGRKRRPAFPAPPAANRFGIAGILALFDELISSEPLRCRMVRGNWSILLNSREAPCVAEPLRLPSLLIRYRIHP